MEEKLLVHVFLSAVSQDKLELKVFKGTSRFRVFLTSFFLTALSVLCFLCAHMHNGLGDNKMAVNYLFPVSLILFPKPSPS